MKKGAPAAKAAENSGRGGRDRPRADRTMLAVNSDQGPDLPVSIPRLKFGDPVSISRSRERGLKPKKTRKSRAAYLNPKERKASAPRYQPIWQRIEGEWKRYRCGDCHSAAFIVIEQEGAFVSVRCAVGHDGTVLSGFAMSKPDG